MTARILIIEDHPDNMELMVCLLEAFGHVPLPAMNGEKGLEIARQELPDLIICDVHLPKMDGFGVLQHLKSEPALRCIPLIAVTALAMVGDRQKVLNAGFDGYIGKPIDPRAFVAHVEQFMRANLRSTSVTFGTDASIAPTPNLPIPKGMGSVLVVDDMLSNREFIRCALESHGYRVVLANNARNGMERTREFDFDLILCDLHMPDEDGIDFITKVKSSAHLQAVPFIFISAALADAKQQKRLLQHGAMHFIQRPVEPQMLIKAVDHCLRNASSIGIDP
ncbi:MAG: response regulator [Herminiimonas sp.]|nr:response regulator [Herminiimonas sp.]